MATINGTENLSAIIDSYVVELDKRALNESYFNDPVLWAKDRLNVDLYWKQREITESLVNNHKTAVKAGHGVGKSFWAALMVCWWVDTRPIQRVFAATTAPSADQVAGILWREIRKAHQLSHKLYAEYLRRKKLGQSTTGLPDHPLPGYITQENKWKDDLGNTIAQGRKPPDNKAEDAFQGFHDGHVLAIGDEACGLNESMIDGLDNITTNDNSRVVLIGNPTNPMSYFGKIFKDDTGTWSLHTISVMDSPNFHGGGLCDCHLGEPLGMNMGPEALENLTNQGYVDRKAKDYGADSPRYMSRVLGEFAYDAGNTLFSEFDLAQARNAMVFPFLEEPYVVLGVDIARMGQDSTYVYRYDRGYVQATHPLTNEPLGKDAVDDGGQPLLGGRLRHVEHWKDAPFVSRVGPDGKVVRGTAERINDIALAVGAAEVRIDASGMGMGVIDPLFVMAKGRYLIIEMYGSGPTPDKRAYHNNRAFRLSEMRRMCFQGLIDIDPEDETLIDELGGIQYGFSITTQGMLIESKESMKKRGVSSPDAADAAWYACADLTEEIEGRWAEYNGGEIIVEEMEPEGSWYADSYSW